MNAPIIVTNAAAVRGRIESVQFGSEFLVVEGWVATADGAQPLGEIVLRVAGADHAVTGLFARDDLRIEGISAEPIAFCVDLPVERRALPGGAVELLVDGQTIEHVSLSDPRCRSFRPQGALEVVSAEAVSGWLFDPGLWLGKDPAGGVELIVGTHRLPVSLAVIRKDLPYSSGRSGQQLGFQLHLLDAIAKSFGRDAATQLRTQPTIDVRLVTQGFQVASAVLSTSGAPVPRPAAPAPAAPAPQPAKPAPAPVAAAPAPKPAPPPPASAFKGGETLSRLGRPVHFETEEVIAAPGAGAMLIGWLVDPQRQVASIRLRSPNAASRSLLERWIAFERPDVFELHGRPHGLPHNRLGFRAFADGPDLDLGQAYVELTMKDGAVAFKPLPRPTASGRDAIQQALGRILVTSDTLAETMAIMAPTAVAMKRAQAAKLAAPTELAIGPSPESPRASIIVPLYGRLDFLTYQMALFSEHDAGEDEYLYVLDQPERRAECIELARSAYRRFGIPMRLIIMPENVGFGGASNAGLQAARGRHICFLNSDVLPGTPDWIGQLSAALDGDPELGVIGARLLFEDGTVQHIGMALQRQPTVGNLLFPIHPRKGRIPPPGEGIRDVEMVTGALMMMRRDLALECGGFDPAYVIGDFEDADLCMRIRGKGLTCAVHDDVTLYHLERQSQGTAATDWTRNLTFVNAWTFNQRWGDAGDQAA